MCIAIAKPMGVEIPSEETLRQCWLNNPDGAGFAFAHEGNVFIKKGFMTWDAFIASFNYWNEKIDFKNKGMLIHFRIATHGGTNRSMTHPFPIDTDEGALSKPEYITNYAVIHNGIISLTSSKASKTHVMSDTAIFIRDYLSLISKNKRWFNNPYNIQLIEKLIDSKMAILDRFGNIKMTSGFDADNGVYYSNKTYQDNYYRKSTKYFAYDYDDDYDYGYYYRAYSKSGKDSGKNNGTCAYGNYTTKYNTSTGHYDTVKHIPLMKVRIGDTIEYDGGSIFVTREEDLMYYVSEEGDVFVRYNYTNTGVSSNYERDCLYEYIGNGSVYDSNIKEVPFKATCWISEDNFLTYNEYSNSKEEESDAANMLKEIAETLEKELKEQEGKQDKEEKL